MSRSLLLLVAGALIGFLATTPTVSHADYVQESASACVADDGDDYFSSNGRLRNASSTSNLSVACGFPSQTGIRHDSVTFLSVDVYDQSSSASVIAFACITDFNGFSHSCGSSTSTGSSFTGVTSLFPSRSAWSGAGSDYGYIQLTLPPGASALHGFYGSN